MSKLKVLSAVLISSIALTGCLPDTPPQTTVPQQQNTTAKSMTSAIGWPFNVSGDVEALEQSDLTELLRPNYWVVFDDSGSMDSSTCDGSRTSRLSAARSAMVTFYDLVANDSNIGLMTLNRGTLVPLEPKSAQTNTRQIIQGIQSGGGTKLNRALVSAYNVLTTQAKRQDGYGEYHLVVITDGESSDGSIDHNINAIIDDTMVTVHAIGLCSDSNRALNQKGRTNYTSARNAADLKAGLQAVLAETDEVFDDSTVDAVY
jgi:Mg-chelatase subunit ChlD